MSTQYPIPENDGEIALWPNAREMIRSIQRKIILPDWMKEAKAQSLHELGFAPDEKIIMTGHQIGFSHPGVWFKNALISELAKHANAHAVYIAMDTDAPKDLSLNAIPFGNADVPWMGILGALWIADLEKIRRKTADPQLESFFELMKRNASGKLSEQLLKTLFTLDLELGLNYTPVLSSRLWDSTGYLRFAKWFLSDPIKIAQAYNLAMGEQPIWKPLEISDDQCESPFWADLLKVERRQRLFLKKCKGEWLLEIGKDQVGLSQIREAMAELKFRLTPRAALNSIYLKTLSDYFIHGVGGGEYERVVDRFMRTIGLPQIPYGISTATLYAPQARGMKRIDPARTLQLVRHAQCGWDDPIHRDQASEMETLPRRSPSRARLFEQMKKHLKEHVTRPDTVDRLKRLQEELDQAKKMKKWMNRGLFHRIQPEERLLGLVAKILPNP